MTTLQIINLAIMLAFFLCYSYQFFYIPVAWFKKDAPHREPSPHRIAVLIAARNEQSVIGNLIDSVKAQDYPTELVDVFVVADNCTDLTGSVAGAHGANVYFRNDQTQVGKGYALQYLLHCIEEDFAPYDGYLVLDADNVLSPNYITEINKTFSDGYQIVTSYRNSKNYADNWISAGYALWFLRESRYLNGARMRLGTSAAVGGTGFLFSQRILDKTNGWQFYLLTEDIEFSVRHITDGEVIAICEDAVLYDEQPTDFRQSCRQRLGQGLHPGVPEVRRQAAEGRSPGQLELLRYGHGHHARLCADVRQHPGQCDAGGHRSGRGRRTVVRHAVPAGVPGRHLSDAAGHRRRHHCHRVGPHPGSRLAESDVHIQLPPVHVHLYPHLLCGAVHEGGVEAHPPRRGGTPAGKLNEKLNFPYCAAPHFPV